MTAGKVLGYAVAPKPTPGEPFELDFHGAIAASVEEAEKDYKLEDDDVIVAVCEVTEQEPEPRPTLYVDSDGDLWCFGTDGSWIWLADRPDVGWSRGPVTKPLAETGYGPLIAVPQPPDGAK